jgi:GT2 family glycosyltransferase
MPSEILVYDNNSFSEDKELLREVVSGTQGVTAVFGERNLGFGAGVNRAVASAESSWDYAWVLNPDIVLEPSTLRILSSAMEKTSSDVASPLILDANDNIWFAGGTVDTRRGRATHDGIGEPWTLLKDSIIDTTFVTGAAPLISRRAWDSLGGFREDLFLYWEDADLSLRAVDSGYRMIVVPGAKVWHFQGGSSDGGVGPTYIYYVQRNRIILFREYGRVIDLMLGVGAFETFKLVLLPIRSGRNKLASKILACVRGTVDGLKGVK